MAEVSAFRGPRHAEFAVVEVDTLGDVMVVSNLGRLGFRV